MRVSADNSKCVVSCMCVYRAPELFDQDETDGRVALLAVAVPPDADAVALRAVQACPSGAIALVAMDGPTT